MSYVKYESEYEITSEKSIKVFWCLGDGDNGEIDDTYGLEIQVDEFIEQEDYLNGINCFSFGYESWSHKVWEEWGRFIEHKIQDIPKTEQGFEEFCNWLIEFDCNYTRSDNHLKDLDKIKAIIESNK